MILVRRLGHRWQGILSGNYSRSHAKDGEPKRLDSMQLQPLNERNLAIADAVGNAANKLSVTPSQVAFAWIISRGVIAIAGARKSKQMKDTLASVDLGLPDAIVYELDAVSEFELGHPYSMLQWDKRGVAAGKRVQAMGGAKNHGIVMPDAGLDMVVNDLAGRLSAAPVTDA